MEFIYSLVSLYKFTKTMFLLNKLNFILALAVSLQFLEVFYGENIREKIQQR